METNREEPEFSGIDFCVNGKDKTVVTVFDKECKLLDSFEKRGFLTCFKISNYLAKNEKENPLVMIIPQIFSYFSNLLLIHCLNDTSKSSVASALKINPFFADDYLVGFRNYKLKEITKILEFIKIADLNSKGIGTTGNVNSSNILPELTYKILNFKA